MLKNFWYACEFSAAVTTKPKQVRILNQKFVFYRNGEGQLIALQDRCPHRGAALSLGWVKDDCIHCPYHAWKFQADGKCINIPANQPGIPIPKNARVDSYPIQEKYGFIWLFYGDLPEEERPPIPPLPEFEDPRLQKIFFEYELNAHYTRTLENDMDMSHVSIIHSKSFGNGFALEQKMEDYELNVGEWEGHAKVNVRDYTKAKDIFAFVFRPLKANVKVTLGFYMPNITRLVVDFGRGKLVNFTVHVPIDDRTTITKRIQFRSFLTFPWADGIFQRAAYKVVMEDKGVVESEYPIAVPDKLSDEVHVPCDNLSLAYRKLRQKCLAMGWGMKPYQNQSNNSNGNLIQPSPQKQGRRQEAEGRREEDLTYFFHP
ncbi:MAG: aromatic ring-hydroxylating dioxygenase subunit alpha [Nostoc sp. DedQUE05]|uniref:aromatic ring-hydroxylating dioxygenase subunit alpha n=1 Tax=Nostoc sp. DedQUE05 TaxID=3075391 RepID=UPI002AD499BD|nr:aromatic ring-hydroxylating dioxygenase subunit alpha [Nostoc sp. DedQUE05]MDZ8095368.1 aromatic ring-hydroxylating dioxygenase subunit alpha [Nostoc sp. DedQUE05]